MRNRHFVVCEAAPRRIELGMRVRQKKHQTYRGSSNRLRAHIKMALLMQHRSVGATVLPASNAIDGLSIIRIDHVLKGSLQ